MATKRGSDQLGEPELDGEVHPDGGEPREPASNPSSGFWDSFPREKSAFVFHVAAAIGTGLISVPLVGHFIRFLGRFCSILLIFITPIVPFAIRRSIVSKRGILFYSSVFFITMFFCFLLSAAFSCFSGTLAPFSIPILGRDFCIPTAANTKTGTRLFFLNDKPNIFLYLVVCPAYVTCSISLITCCFRYWRDLKAAADSAHRRPFKDLAYIGRERAKHKLVMSFYTIALLTFVSVLMSNYLGDLIDQKRTPHDVYWFLSETRDGSERILNQAGLYYLLLNTGLLLVTTMAAFSYLSMATQLVRVARAVGNSKIVGVKEGQELPRVYDEFFYCYIMAKVLIFIYAINIIVWKESPAGQTSNIYVAIYLLSLAGLIVIPFPRMYLEYKVHQHNRFHRGSYMEYLPTPAHLMALFVNSLFVLLLFYAAKETKAFGEWTESLEALLSTLFG